MDISEARQLRQLEEDNLRLKRLVAEQVLDILVLKDVLGKVDSVSLHKAIVQHVIEQFGYSERCACWLIGINRKTYRRTGKLDADTAVRQRLRELAQERPRLIQVDNGPEFVGKALDQWAYEHAVKLQFIRPGKPTENAYVESFNGRLREECLNQHIFVSLADARQCIEAWRTDYNSVRPHSALGQLAPDQFRLLHQSNVGQSTNLRLD